MSKLGLFLTLFGVFALAACTPKNSITSDDTSTTTSDSTSESSSDTTSDTTGDTTSEPPTYENSYSVSFDDVQEIGGGTGIDKHKDTFVALFNKESTILEEIDCQNVYIQNIGLADGTSKNKLTLGSRSSEGTLTFTFFEKIIGFEIACRSYFKSYSYGGNTYFNNDSDCVLEVEASSYQNSYPLPSATEAESEIQTCEFALENPTTILTINNVGDDYNRVFIESITLFY